MKSRLLIAAVAAVAMLSQFSALRAQNVITDSVDAIHYDLTLDIGNKTAKRIEGSAEVTLAALAPADTLTLELKSSDIDSVLVDGTPAAFRHTLGLLHVAHSVQPGDTVTVTVYYRKGQYLASNEWGGFYFENNIYYNLGIAIYEYPHNMGKAWFPCRDNFYDKATYHFAITAKPSWKAICTGINDSVVYHDDGSSTWYWTLNRLTPTYLVGVAVAPFHIIERSYQGLHDIYPATLGFLSHDSTNVWNAFDNMSRVIPFYEQCFGPYMWDRVGYVSTSKGSMEHVGNVAFTTYCMASQQEACLATMSHEFSHSWFGNLITCSSSENMWINEGGASFAEEVAIQAIQPDGDSLRYKGYADENLNNVLISTHVIDDGFRPLYGVPPAYTYGSTVYNKGATVWHSLRGYMGDSLFYASLRTLFSRCAFGNVDSYQLRDSLSAYSGINLDDFFQFHVFGPGFNDYVIDSLTVDGNNTTVFLRQSNYGTQNLMNSNRVWVTFFSDMLQKESRLLTFDGATATATFQLPFTTAFAVVDYDKALSKASIGSELAPLTKGEHDLAVSLFKSNVRSISNTDSTFIYVTHHWSKPDTSISPRFLRMADRYWDVTGLLPADTKLSGQFQYSNSGSNRTLDDNLWSGSDEFNNIRLLYRENSATPWRVVSSLTSGSSAQGYRMINNLKLGQYTLALIDTAYVGIDNPQNTADKKQLSIYPNPSTGTLTISAGELGEQLLVSVLDSGGRTVCENVSVTSGQNCNFHLADGTYIFNVTHLKDNRIYSRKVVINNY